MHITEIDPDKKYVLLMPEANKSEAEELAHRFRSFLKESKHTACFICGGEVSIIPADQVIGYHLFDDLKESSGR